MKNRHCALQWVLMVALVLLFTPGSVHAEESANDSHSETVAEGHDDAHAGGHSHDPGHGNAGASLEDPGEFRADLAIYTFVVFLLLLTLLGKLAWPSISAALLEREKRIEGSIADAEAMHAEAKNMLAQHEAKLATAADEVRDLLDEARRDAEHTKTQIIAEAKQLAGQERDRAVRDVDLAAEKAMHKLVETSANMAVDLAGQVVKQNITPDQQAALVREALSKLASSSPSQN